VRLKRKLIVVQVDAVEKELSLRRDKDVDADVQL